MTVPLESQQSLWILELPLDPGCLVSPLCRHVICFCFQCLGTPDSPHPTGMLPGAGREWEGWGSGQGSRMEPSSCSIPAGCLGYAGAGPSAWAGGP